VPPVRRETAVTGALVGIRGTEKMKENVATVEWRMSPDERQEHHFAEEAVPSHSEIPQITEPFLPRPLTGAKVTSVHPYTRLCVALCAASWVLSMDG